MPKNYDDFFIDNLGTFYFTSNEKFIKQSSTFSNPIEFSGKTLGAITLADVSNHFKLILYYQNFNQLLILDNYLNTLGKPIDLDALGHYAGVLIASSNLGGFWIYDEQQKQIFQYNYEGKLLNKGVVQLSKKSTDKAIYIKEQNNKLYLYFKESGIHIFDQYGNFINIIGLINVDFITIMNDEVYYLENAKLKTYNLLTQQEKEIITINEINTGKKIVFNDKLYIFNREKIINYPLNIKKE